MTDKKVTDLTPATSLDGSEVVYVVQSATDKQATVSQLLPANMKADSSAGSTIKNSSGVTVATFGAGTGTGTTLAGGLVASGLSYPTSDGTSGQVISTDGAGTLSFSTPSGGGGGDGAGKVWPIVNGNDGYHISPSFYASGAQQGVGFSDTIYWQSLPVAKDVTINRIGVHVSSGNSNKARVGIYSSNSDFLPGTLLAESAELTLGTGYQETIISLALTGGDLYWLAFTCNSTAASATGGSINDVLIGVNYFDLSNTSARNYSLRSSTTGAEPTSGSLPSTAPALAGNDDISIPMVYVRSV